MLSALHHECLFSAVTVVKGMRMPRARLFMGHTGRSFNIRNRVILGLMDLPPFLPSKGE